MSKKDIIKRQKLIQKFKKNKLKTKLWIKNKICPECKIKAVDCYCDFTCPSCGILGKYDDFNNILCVNDDCRVRRFWTQ